MDSACDGKVLLVGDGDFSFSLSLLRHSALDASHVFTSNLETPETIRQHQLAAENMDALQDLGATVLLEVDATDLHSHPTISQLKFDRIIFNFPLADRFNIKRNRALLGDFFTSCGSILSEEGQVMVTLCKGQGGTPADNPMRSWHNSWQVVAMATNAGFSLVQVDPFDTTKYPEYHSVGFRFQDKSFNNTGAITHTFERLPMAVPEPLPPRGQLQSHGETYSCSSRILNKRNLLHEANNPVCLMKMSILEALSDPLTLKVKDFHNDNLIVKGFQSLVYTKLNEVQQTSSEEMSEKEKKEDFNKKQQQKENLSFSNEKLDKYCTLERMKKMVPSQAESVFSAVKCLDQNSEDDALNNVNEIDAVVTMTAEGGMSNCTSRVLHMRSSLLEELGNLDLQKTFQEACDSTEMNTNGNCDAENGGHSQEQKDSLGDIPNGCFVLTGQSYQPCNIEPQSSLVKHEILFVRRITKLSDKVVQSDSVASLEETMSTEEPINLNCNTDDFKTIFSDQLFLSTVFSNSTLQVETSDGQCELSVKNIDCISNLVTLEVKSVHKKDSECVGFIFQGSSKGDWYEFCLVNVDILTSSMCALPNIALLWSMNDKFTKQFSYDSFPQKFQPFSLYPMQFVHELNFCLQESTDTLDEMDLWDAIGCVASGFVVSVGLKEASNDLTTGRHSRCYRLHFLSHDYALPYSTSWTLQSAIRLEVARRLGVTLK